MTGRSAWWMLALGLGACAAAPGDPPGGGATAQSAPATLTGTRWIGVLEPPLPPQQMPRLEFVTDSRLMGFTGCNMLSGSWSAQGGEVRLGPIAITKRMCLGPEGEVERRVLAALSDRSRVSREGGKLVVTGPDGQRFEFAQA